MKESEQQTKHMEIKHMETSTEFGIWTLPATMGAVRLAQESRFQPAHYDAVERAVRRSGAKQITRQDVANVKTEIDTMAILADVQELAGLRAQQEALLRQIARLAEAT